MESGSSFTSHAEDIAHGPLLGEADDITHKFVRDVHRIDLASGPHRPGEQPRIQPGTGTDIGNTHSRLDGQGLKDVIAPVKHLSPLGLKTLYPDVKVRFVAIIVIDPGTNALFREHRGAGGEQHPEQSEKAAGFSCYWIRIVHHPTLCLNSNLYLEELLTDTERPDKKVL